MYTIDQYRPRRQTMQNVKPADYVPFEDVVRTSIYLQPKIDAQPVVIPTQN